MIDKSLTGMSLLSKCLLFLRGKEKDICTPLSILLNSLSDHSNAVINLNNALPNENLHGSLPLRNYIETLGLEAARSMRAKRFKR